MSTEDALDFYKLLEDSATSLDVDSKLAGMHRPYPNQQPLVVADVMREVNTALEEVAVRQVQ